jgi:type IV pilus assembly protein PilX
MKTKFNIRTSSERFAYPSAVFLRKQKGIALITSIFILVILTVLAVSMFRSNIMQLKIAGNVREKERSFQSAQGVLQYGEWWLLQQGPDVAGIGVNCSRNIRVQTTADVIVCANGLTNANSPESWPGSLQYAPAGMKVSSEGGKILDGNSNMDINYYSFPQLYVSYMGPSLNKKSTIYAVTGAGFGGTDTSVSVVQSILSVTYKVIALDN